ncbi:site-specific integrase [Micropruina sp.]|uniref:site-specific integrase n=1 Tax=Micropruina sp. TaxID=2737536 RepID=UPI0039E3F9E8
MTTTTATRANTSGGNSKGTRRRFGYMRRLPSKRWQASYTGPDGNTYKAPTTFATKSDADTWLSNESSKISRGTWRSPTQLAEEARRAEAARAATFAKYAQEVIDRRLATEKIRETSHALYAKLIRLHLNPAFGKMPLRDITPGHVRTWYAKQKGSRANSYGLLRTILGEAVRDEIISRNPAMIEGGSTKRAAREGEVLSPGDMVTLRDDDGREVERDALAAYFAAVPEYYRVPVTLAFWCGLRSGEVRGLRRRDLDLAAGTVTVRQQIVKLKGRNVISSLTKTDAGRRKVALPPHIVPALRTWLADQPVAGRDALLFHSPHPRFPNAPMSGESLRAAQKKAAAAIGRPGLRVHDLRHSAATMTAGAGATLAELQARFGWATPSMAARYTHAQQERDAALAEKLSQAVAAPEPTVRRPARRRRAR